MDALKMLRSLFAQRLAQEQELRQNLEHPLGRYMLESFIANRHLLSSDMCTYLDFVRRNEPPLLTDEAKRNADLPKCNIRAAKARQEGNQFYRKKDYREALKKYNESICWSRSDSEELAIGFANRSAVYYECGEYEFALANIALAKKHNYPNRLVLKLQAREINCKSKIEADEERNSPQLPKIVLNVELNPKIPCVAKGITMKVLPRFGRSMVAEKDFKVGNVILCEKLMMASVNANVKYELCQFCSSDNLMSLIPCPHCTSAMFCNEECFEKGWKVSHRFECGICDKIAGIPFDQCHMAPKMFFYGLTLFNDDVKAMMKYCMAHARTGSNPFDLDYTKEDPLAEFKVFHTAKTEPHKYEVENVYRFMSAMLYTIYIQQPTIRSLFIGKAERNFMLNCFFDYCAVTPRLVIARNDEYFRLMHTVASVCNHSCDPNAHVLCYSGQMKFVVTRPISKGDQICISYGPIWGVKSNVGRLHHLSLLEIECVCEVCYKDSFQRWISKGKRHPPIFHHHFKIMQEMLEDETTSQADRLNAVQQFIQRYAYVHPMDIFQPILTMYRDGIEALFEAETMVTMRKKALKL